MDDLMASARLSRRLFRRMIDDVPDTLARSQVAPNTNHMAFLALHLVDARSYAAKLMAGPELSHGFEALLEAAQGMADIVSFPPLADVLTAWEWVSDALEARLATQTDEDAARSVGHTYPNGREDLRGALGFLLYHEAYHVGQLNLLRKGLGLEPVGFQG